MFQFLTVQQKNTRQLWDAKLSLWLSYYFVLCDLNIQSWFWGVFCFFFFFFSKQLIFNGSHYSSLFHLPVAVTKRGKSRLWMPGEKNSFHSLIRFTGRLPLVPRVVESKKALSSQARSQLTQANSCTSGTEYSAWFSFVVWGNKKIGKQTSCRILHVKAIKRSPFHFSKFENKK